MPRVSETEGNRRQSDRIGIQDAVAKMPDADIAFYGVRPVGEGGDKKPLRIICRIGLIAKVVENRFGTGAFFVCDEVVQEISS